MDFQKRWNCIYGPNLAFYKIFHLLFNPFMGWISKNDDIKFLSYIPKMEMKIHVPNFPYKFSLFILFP